MTNLGPVPGAVVDSDDLDGVIAYAIHGNPWKRRDNQLARA
jgi:hypothetical protein